MWGSIYMDEPPLSSSLHSFTAWPKKCIFLFFLCRRLLSGKKSEFGISFSVFKSGITWSDFDCLSRNNIFYSSLSSSYFIGYFFKVAWGCASYKILGLIYSKKKKKDKQIWSLFSDMMKFSPQILIISRFRSGPRLYVSSLTLTLVLPTDKSIAWLPLNHTVGIFCGTAGWPMTSFWLLSIFV